MSLEPYSDMIFDMAKQSLSSAEIAASILHQRGGGRGFYARNVRDFAPSLRGLPHGLGVGGGKSHILNNKTYTEPRARATILALLPETHCRAAPCTTLTLKTATSGRTV